MDKPLLMVEGIDADQHNGPEAYFALGASLLTTALSYGADVMILDFPDGGRPIGANAEVVAGAIAMIQRLKTNPQRGTDVIGVSMGGVATRWALAKMEQDRYAHEVMRFVSLDAPQQGAVFDTELQRVIKEANYNNGTPVPLSLARVAAGQMLKWNRFDLSGQRHIQFYDSLRALNGQFGYSARTENVGVSFGTATANPNSGSRWASIQIFSLIATPNFDVTGSVAVGGSFLPYDATNVQGLFSLGYGHLKVGLPYELTRHTDPTFIPFTSALDLTSNVSRFDGPTIYPATPFHHDRLPREIEPRLIHRLGYDVPLPQWAVVSGPVDLDPDELGRWKVDTSVGDTAGYTTRWHYRIVWDSCTDPGGEARQVSTGSRLPSGGVISPNRVSCDWHDAGITGRFAYSTPYPAHLELQAQILHDQGTLWTPVFTAHIGQGVGGYRASISEGASSTPFFSETPTLGLAPLAPSPVRKGEALHVRLSLAASGPVSLHLYDVTGRRIATLYDGAMGEDEHAQVLDTSVLTPGTYLLRLASAGRVTTRPLVVLD